MDLDSSVNHFPPDIILSHFSPPFASWRLCARHSELLSPLAIAGTQQRSRRAQICCPPSPSPASASLRAEANTVLAQRRQDAKEEESGLIETVHRTHGSVFHQRCAKIREKPELLICQSQMSLDRGIRVNHFPPSLILRYFSPLCVLASLREALRIAFTTGNTATLPSHRSFLSSITEATRRNSPVYSAPYSTESPT